jgi:pyridoxamine 5'-phosphate oxidase
MNLSDLRHDFGTQRQADKEHPENPFLLFDKWLEQAINFPIVDANAMVLSTVNQQQHPSSRIVLLKAYGQQEGFVFFTDYQSQKGNEMKQNPFAALHFFWSPLERQIRIEGKVEKTSRKKSIDYFNSRPIESRASAIVSHQSQPIEHPERLAERQQALLNMEKSLHCPERWGGYTLHASRFEFWQGGVNRLHHRLVYELNQHQWDTQWLAP